MHKLCYFIHIWGLGGRYLKKKESTAKNGSVVIEIYSHRKKLTTLYNAMDKDT